MSDIELLEGPQPISQIIDTLNDIINSVNAGLAGELDASLSNGKIYVGNASGVPVGQTPSGAVTMTNAGVFSLASSINLPGSPTTTTQSPGDNSTKIATTAYVDALATLIEAGDVDSVNGYTGTVSLVKGDIGLGNVDNTSDANKPVSTAQQTAIDNKVADAINDGTTTIAPSQNAVFDALAGKAASSHTHVSSDVTDFTAAAKAATVADAINNGTTDIAPSQNAVFDALALKQGLDAQLTSVAALSFAGNSLKVVRLNAGETDFEFATISGGAANLNDLGDVFYDTGNNNLLIGDVDQAGSMTGTDNISIGVDALDAITSGERNIALGGSSLGALTDGIKNTAIGLGTLSSLVTGDDNVGVGNDVLGNATGNNNVAIGSSAAQGTTSGSANIVVGGQSGDDIGSGSNNILIGHAAQVPALNTSNHLNIGSLITGTVAGEKNVTMNGTGALAVHSGTAAQRPAAPVNGMIRYNTDANTLEAYINSTWKTITAV